MDRFAKRECAGSGVVGAVGFLFLGDARVVVNSNSIKQRVRNAGDVRPAVQVQEGGQYQEIRCKRSEASGVAWQRKLTPRRRLRADWGEN